MNTRKPDEARPASAFRSLFSIQILGCLFSVIVSPLLLFFTSGGSGTMGEMETRYENKIFWPVLAVAALVVALQNLSRGARVILPPHIICLLVYLGFAGLSVVWAFSPQQSLMRFIQQAMIITSIVLPAVVALRPQDLMRGLFLCLAIAAFLNVFFLFGGYQTIADHVAIGYSGYMQSKNYLGEFAALALVVSLHEIVRGWKRTVFGVLVAFASVVLLFFADSKTALGLAVIVPIIAGALLVIRRTTSVSPEVVIWCVILGYFVISEMTGFSMARVSYMLYDDSSFTGRQVIWDFAHTEIAKSPLIGWGYQSFWLVGPTGPSIVDGPGWVKYMPNAHNGYYDTILELGYIGLVMLAAFLTATVRAIGRVIDYDVKRGWVMLSVVLYVGIHNGLESTWMRGFEVMWIVLLIVVADVVQIRRQQIIGRHLRSRVPAREFSTLSAATWAKSRKRRYREGARRSFRVEGM
jgi:exopolysaccharide production protein ExoQ